MPQDALWIDNVGGVVHVGASLAYEGAEYIDPSDDDTDTKDYSTVAGIDYLDDGSTLEALWTVDEVGALMPKVKVKANNDWVLMGPAPGMAGFSRWEYFPKHSNAAWSGVVDVKLVPTGSNPDKRKLTAMRNKQIDGFKNPGKYKNTGAGGMFGAAAKSFDDTGKDIVHTLNAVARLPETVIKETLGRVPGIGGPIRAAIKLSPNEALSGLSSRVMAGERLDKAFISVAKEQVRAAREVAPYVQTVMSVVPGVGTGVAAAIAAGTALAEGRTITEALLNSVKGALPGGPIAAMAFDAATAAVQGKSPEDIALAAVRGQLPPAAQVALDTAVAGAKGRNVLTAAMNAVGSQLPADVRRNVEIAERAAKTGLAVAKGKNPKDAILQAVRAELPEQARKALDIGIAMGAGASIQGKTNAKSMQKKSVEKFAKDGANILKKAPKLRSDLPPTLRAAKGLDKEGMAGYQAALGAATKSGYSAQTLASIRATLGAKQRVGFDHALKMLLNDAHPDWKTVVKGGKVIRGPWKAATSKDKGAVQGRMIAGGKVTKGYYVR